MGLKRQKYSSLGDLLDHEPITEEDVNVRPAESNSGRPLFRQCGVPQA